MYRRQVDGQHLAAVALRQGGPAIDDELVGQARLVAGVRHGVEVAKRVGVGERAVLAKTFLVVAVLDEVDGPAGGVGARIDTPDIVEIHA